MPLPPTIIPAKPRVRRKRKTATSALPAVLTLVSATYDEGVSIRLTFDRAIDIGAFDPSAIVVNDGELSVARFEATLDVSLVSPEIVEIVLSPIGASSPGVYLNATNASGIVAVNDGGTWAGVSELPLPWP